VWKCILGADSILKCSWWKPGNDVTTNKDFFFILLEKM